MQDGASVSVSRATSGTDMVWAPVSDTVRQWLCEFPTPLSRLPPVTVVMTCNCPTPGVAIAPGVTLPEGMRWHFVIYAPHARALDTLPCVCSTHPHSPCVLRECSPIIYCSAERYCTSEIRTTGRGRNGRRGRWPCFGFRLISSYHLSYHISSSGRPCHSILDRRYPGPRDPVTFNLQYAMSGVVSRR